MAKLKTDDLAMLIDYYYCTGCHTCEVGCKERFALGEGEFGIKLAQNGPLKQGDLGHGTQDWELNYVPIPTRYCDFCIDRLEAGKKALCEQQCQAFVITVAPIDELVPQMKEGKQMVLYNKPNDGDNKKLALW